MSSKKNICFAIFLTAFIVGLAVYNSDNGSGKDDVNFPPVVINKKHEGTPVKTFQTEDVLSIPQENRQIARKHPPPVNSTSLLSISPKLDRLINSGFWYTQEEALNLTSAEVEELYTALDSKEYQHVWGLIAMLIAHNDDPVAATEKLIAFLEDDSAPDDDKGDFISRMGVIRSLGFLRTERSAEYLLNAYKNFRELKILKKELHRRNLRGYTLDFELEIWAMNAILPALWTQDVEKYSSIVEADFAILTKEALIIDLKPLPHTIQNEGTLSMYFVYTEGLYKRDIIRDHGIDVYMTMSSDDFEEFSRQYAPKYNKVMYK